MKNTYYNLSIYILVILNLFFISYAHGGRTGARGCHNCRTGSCAGTYHCHGGTTPIIPVTTTNQHAPAISQVQPPTQNNTANKSQSIPNASSEGESIDTTVFLTSILGAFGLGYFIYSIFNR